MAQGALGLAALVFTAWLLSENRRRFETRTVLVGLALQFVLALLFFKVPWFKAALSALNDVVLCLDKATMAGTSFVFGHLGGAEPPYEIKGPGTTFILAFKALPLVLVVSALSSALFYWRVLPLVVRAFSLLLRKTMGIGGALGVGVSANIFVGMIEAPLFIRPYLDGMSRGELLTLMTSGMATIAGTMMVLYAGILGPVIPDALGHVLVASMLSAPAAVLVSRIMIPETGLPTTGDIAPPNTATGTMDAITKGTLDGLTLLLNIIAMLVVLVALVSLVNQILGFLPDVLGQPITLQNLLGLVMRPVVWLIGVPWSEAGAAGSLMGVKTVLNEFLAYLDMAALPPGTLSEKSRVIMTYAMCGFANFGSLGIMIGGLGAMAPARRTEIVGLGLKSIVSGTLATLMTGAVAGMLY